MSRDLILRQRGFTVVEILLVIAIIGVLLAIAAPSFVSYTSNVKVKSASFDLYAALIFARSEAIKRRQIVTVAPVSSDWKNGWTIVANIGGVDTTLRTQDALSGVNFYLDPALAPAVFRMDGRLNASFGKLLIKADSPQSTEYRCVKVDLSGLPKSIPLDRNLAYADATVDKCPS